MIDAIPSGSHSVVDCNSLLPGADVTLQRPDTSDSLHFVMCNGSKEIVLIICQWHHGVTTTDVGLADN